MKASTDIKNVLVFWFGSDPSAPLYNRMEWWQKKDAFDQSIKQNFGELHALACEGALDDWATTSQGALALIIILDQFSRNLFRGSPDMYAQDSKALAIAKETIEKGIHNQLSLIEQVFIFMPFEHSESIADQKICVEFFENLVNKVPQEYKDLAQFYLKFAKEHHDIIERFGRFPHRNGILKRESTEQEVAFVKHHDGF